MTETDFDLVVIGGGPGGYVAALRAAQLGLRTALVEREHLGGICLNWGCIPTKSLLHTADTLRSIRQAEGLGLVVAEPEVDFPRVMARSRTVAGQLNRGVTHLLKRAGVTVFQAQARFDAGRKILATGEDGTTHTLSAPHVILATGAHPRELPALPFDGRQVWHYRDALSATELPASLLVIGAGAIGLEFASFYAALGSEVTVVEALPRVLPSADAEVSDFVAKAFARDGIHVLTNTRLEHAVTGDGGVEARVSSEAGVETLTASRVLVAIGLVGNSDGLGLEHTAVQLEHGRVVTNPFGETDEPGVYAIGDLAGAPMLAHKASHEAVACVERIAGLRTGDAHPASIPACTYCHPQTASVGLTEQEVEALGREFKVGRFPLSGNGKALVLGEPEGFVKTLFDAGTGALLGAHIVGPDAAELIQGFTLAISLEATEAELMETVFAHPTLSEAMHESVLAAFDRALHI